MEEADHKEGDHEGEEVHQGDSTPSLSPESINSNDKEGKERNCGGNFMEDELEKDVVKEVLNEEVARQTTSRELCLNEGGKIGDTDSDDVDSSSEEDSVKEEEEPKKIVRSRSHSVEKSAD